MSRLQKQPLNSCVVILQTRVCPIMIIEGVPSLHVIVVVD